MILFLTCCIVIVISTQKWRPFGFYTVCRQDTPFLRWYSQSLPSLCLMRKLARLHQKHRRTWWWVDGWLVTNSMSLLIEFSLITSGFLSHRFLKILERTANWYMWISNTLYGTRVFSSYSKPSYSTLQRGMCISVMMVSSGGCMHSFCSYPLIMKNSALFHTKISQCFSDWSILSDASWHWFGEQIVIAPVLSASFHQTSSMIMLLLTQSERPKMRKLA